MPYSGSVLSLRRLRPCRHRPLRPAAQPLTSQALPPRACLGSELTLTAQRPPTKGNESCPGPPGSGPKCFHRSRPCSATRPAPHQNHAHRSVRTLKTPPPRVSLMTRCPALFTQDRSFLLPRFSQTTASPGPAGSAPSQAPPPRPQTTPCRAVASPPPGRGSGGCAGCAACSASLRAVAPRRAAQSSR